MEIVREDAIHSPFSGRKPQRREDTYTERTTARRNQELTNPVLVGRDQKEAEGRSIVTGWRNSPGTGVASTREREAKGWRRHRRRREGTYSIPTTEGCQQWATVARAPHRRIGETTIRATDGKELITESGGAGRKGKPATPCQIPTRTPHHAKP
jgi:hypothetical protein